MDGYTLVFDIDGTICPIKQPDEKYEDIIPFADIVKKMRQCKRDGARIILYTSRNMRTYGGNMGLINKNTAKTLLEWLDKWEIPYDEIFYGKPWAGEKGLYIDDRTVRPSEFLSKDIAELERICKAEAEK